uniref:Ig-like domain-containing protein n=2 Tax=Oreochromis TaxID=8139 RepID=A0A669C3D2_ORENI
PAESISVTAGDSATLECTVSGSPDLKVKWFKDGKEIISGRKYKMTLKDNIATLKILTAEKGDTSEYKMEVANKVGKDQCTCSVTVLGWLLVSGSQPMTVTWFKDDQEIVSGDKFQPEFKDSSAILRIMWLEKADSGVYKCRATNSAGFKETSGTLYVKGHILCVCFLHVISELFYTNVKCKFVLLAFRTPSVHSETTRPGLQSNWQPSHQFQMVQG